MNNCNFYQRKDGRWEGRISFGKDSSGKKKYLSFYGKTREEAEYKLMLFCREISEKSALTEMTVEKLVDEWFQIMSSRIKESTIANYRMKAKKHIIPAFGDINCCLLKTKDIYDFIEKKTEEGLSARYISDIIVLLKSIFRYANREYHVQNVCENIIMPKNTRTEIKIFSKKQQEKLEQYINSDKSLTSLGISLSMYMGMRIGEVCALQWSDVDFEKRTISITKTIQRIQLHNEKGTRIIISSPKSESSVREIPIPDCLISMLGESRNSADYYVLSGSRKPVEPRAMQYRFEKILKINDLPSVHFHSLRHLFATNCIALGFDVKTLSEILGHSSVETTLSRYVHSSMERKRLCMEMMKTASSLK